MSRKPDPQSEDNFVTPLLQEAALSKSKAISAGRMLGEARQVLLEMESWLQESRRGLDVTDEAKKKKFTRREALLWEMRGRLAEAEDRKPDAAVFYLTATRLNPSLHDRGSSGSTRRNVPAAYGTKWAARSRVYRPSPSN